MLKMLGAQIKEFKKDSIKTPLFMILEVLMEMLIPFLMASIIDDGVDERRYPPYLYHRRMDDRGSTDWSVCRYHGRCLRSQCFRRICKKPAKSHV